MADKLKEIQTRVIEWWNRFTSKQKTIIIGIGAVVVFTFAILIYVFSQPKYIKLADYETTSEAAEVIEILDSAGITHVESDDGLRIDVEASQISQANVALGAAGFVPDDYNLDEAFGSGFGTTESERQKRWSLLLEDKLEADFSNYNAVKKANVLLTIPNQDGTLLAKQEEASAYISLELDGEFTRENAATMAKAAATFLGNETTNKITIVDTNANALFVGGDEYSTYGIANSMQELRSQAEAMVASQVKRVLLGTGQYNTVEVASNLNVDYSDYERTVKEYYANSDREEGMYAHSERYESENESGAGGPVGTDSNDETGYLQEDGGNTSSSTNEEIIDYLPNESIEHRITPAGAIDYSQSSVAMSAITFREIREEEVRAQGLLDGISWEEYKMANSAMTVQEVDSSFYSLVSHATGIPESSMTIVAYVKPVFYDKAPMDVSGTDVLSIVMLIVILALLVFVVLRSMRSRQVVDEEEELSVENLLQSTPEAELEDIELEAKSETRKMIEKFVDDNPEAAANLLRNWLNEDWN